ncbi:hypothetical protein CO180_04205 [candidate division WWE3 bacterium CG_4_9_14_3_um_filter_41_6]|uniref:Type II secretion system protein GspG C-terminal domain-containing protein n=1 Tax=candidate division WWE3 bacterium CG_4_10_14_0_2_um_filter_41_14 TaxID=1975072 RepID=A0A2M7TK58_UNCKA|nr:MAG: hypothetical protein COY32_02300 [candidate division WWE3 bacterium CG_4_10_14_0_2_um_filter_41_14]PJA38146.1 MAG: hypothetical protein CO180_04205 [candidate division WWE3 bacterium CG_4_9_14_3_um_filter_41_6]
MNRLDRSFGFTLIELLVVIVIIGLLAGIGIASFTGSIDKGKQAKAKSDVKELFDAIKRYRTLEGKNVTADASYNLFNMADWQASGLVPNYIEAIPTDPWGHTYYYDGHVDTEVGAYQSSVCSAGSGGTVTSYNVAQNGDDICMYFQN